MRCDWLVPGFDTCLRTGDEVLECLLAKDHAGYHLVRKADGQYAIWLPDKYPCEECTEAGDYCECFTYDFISDDEAAAMIRQYPTIAHATKT